MIARAFLAAALLAPLPALAHPGLGAVGGFAEGLAHPLGGLDHLAAMLAVGFWAGARGGAARFVLPGAFLAAMLAGFGLGAAGIALPAVEASILASTVLLAVLAGVAAPLPLSLAAALTALFGILHGHPHGAELAAGTIAAAYGGGFLVTTATLHLVGLLVALPLGPLARRAGARVAQYRL